ncbi:MAG: hypothetical protein ABIT37_19415 [Luteolibacter sp.]
MAKVEKIIIACYNGDFWQTKICVASIRHWYPDIPIFLLKDYLKGDFPTAEMEEKLNVSVIDLKRKKFGWGVSKFEPYYFDKRERVLILDSDIIFVGPVLDRVEQFDEDFVLSCEFPEDPHAVWFKETYYDLKKLQETLDPDFQYPGYVFNTGQLVCHTGLFKPEDFRDFVDYGGEVPVIKHNSVLACADQGILNYLLPTMEREGKVTIKADLYQIWSKSDLAKTFDLAEIKKGGGYPYMIHWAGDHSRCIRFLQRPDLLWFFQEQYYKRLPLGELKRRYFNADRLVTHYWNRLLKLYVNPFIVKYFGKSKS